MQPDQPNPWNIVGFIFFKMIATAGEKEVKLGLASSVVRGNVLLDAMLGET